MLIQGDQDSDVSDFQEDSINGSTIIISKPAQQQASVELDDSLIMQDKNDESDSEESDYCPANDDVDQQDSAEILQQDLSSLAMNMIGGDNMQGSEGQHTFVHSDQTQDRGPPDNLTSSTLSTNSSLSRDLNQNTNFLSSDDSHRDKLRYENASKSQTSESFSEETQEPNDDSSNISSSNQNKSINGSSITGKNFKDENFDSEENIRKAHKHYSIDSNSQIEPDKDLAECITGLYRLLDLCEIDGPSYAVNISRDYLKKLCNDMVPSSFKSISEINYTELNSISLRLIGCYGNHTLIAKFLLNKKIIDQQIHDLLIDSQENKSSLRPGIYLLVVNSDLGLVIHWPEIGCYEENASSQHKINLINLHRYLTKLTDFQLCLMNDKDLESFDWNVNNSDLESDEENKSCYEFEIEESQKEWDDFRIYPGFKMNLSQKVKAEMNDNIQFDVPLRPLVVESTSYQSFITRKLAKKLNKNSLTFSALSFSNEFHNILKGRSLCINRKSMNMKQLELLIKNGFETENELLVQFYSKIDAANSQMEEEIEQVKETMREEADIITRIGWKDYSIFEDLFNDSTFQEENTVSEDEINRIQSKYPEVKDMIKQIRISSPTWINLKQRYALTHITINTIYKLLGNNSEAVTEHAIQEFYNMFVDGETNTRKLVEKYERRSQEFFSIDEKPTFDELRINQTDQHSKGISQKKSDFAFVQDLINSPFFRNFKDIKQNVLRIFSDEYQNWIKENFPNSVREIVPTFSFNKNLIDEINEKFSQEKKEIENREFERICEKLEQKFNKGPLCLNVINVTDVDIPQSFCLTYELETNQLQITIYETSLEESDITQIKEDEFFVPNPVLSSHYYTGQYCVDFQIDPIIYEFRKISQFENRKFLLVLYNRKLRQIEIFFDTAQRFPRIFKRSDSIKPFKTFPIDKFFIAVNEPKELIAVLDTNKFVLNVLSFNEDKTNLYARNQNIQISQWYNNTIPKIKHFLFIKNTEELCFVERSGQARIFNLVNLLLRPVVCIFPPNTAKVLSSPDGSCIVAFAKEKKANDKVGETLSDKGKENDVKELCAYIHFCTDFGSSVKKAFKLPTNFQSVEFLQLTCINKLQTHLMSLDLHNGCFNSAIVKITLRRTQYQFQERIQKSFGRVKLSSSHKNANYISVKGRGTHFEKSVQKGQNIVVMGEKYNVIKVISDTKLKVAGNFKPTNGSDKWMKFEIEPIESKINGLIDVYRTMFERYPVENCVDSEQNHPLNLKVVLDISDDEIEEYREKFEDYISDMFENLRRSTKKPTTILKKFSTSVITFQELDIENERFLKKYSSEYELGEWIIKLCCLIPIQIAVVRNNLFQPFTNGDEDEFEEEYGSHIENIVKNISFEWYEGIFKHFGNKKVKVVSSMGEQSYEKSFTLNHLVGTSFDGTSRFTEGVWMSLVNTKKCIYVVLDFEGQRRTPQEDLFLTLFNTFVSNIILFKNQFSVNNNMLPMFQRFQDCAVLFESGSKVFQNSTSAKLCIIIKDIPKVNKENIVTEFKSKFSRLVSEEGKDNFISRMYKGGLDIIPWPTFNDAAWFKSLSNINKKLVRQETKHENARTFLQNTKVIMAKLKICDWSSLDDTFIQIRLTILKRLLPAVVSYGLEQRDPVNELMNHDTGELIEDPAINLPDISHKFEKTAELLPDSRIQLFGENESFAQLSKFLRDYFEKNIQSRNELFDDSRWFASYDKFIKYIIERRILRTWEWYTQNTAKFPKDNSSVVNEKCELEQITTKFTLLWTLCGLTCQSCGLKCIQNRDHSGDHDCLTDHECHFLCDFVDHDELIPRCIYKAGHKGKHICDEMNHVCGKKCHLADKRNCQKICSKEIGHDGEHLCQSTIHYCEKDCSLSTYTQRGNYICPNKCVMPYDVEHDSHRCENETCPILCPVPGCQSSCQSNDHLHAYSDLQVNHFCGNEHLCQELCEEAGVCKVTTVPKRQITFTKYIQNNERLKCNKKIPPNEFKHTGKHTHGNESHYCDTKCPFCGYFCTLPYGHTQIHETRHGNMTQNKFADDDADDEDLELSGYHLEDKETFVLCSLHCKDLERHYHTDYCQSEENCRLGNQKQDIKHIEEQAHSDKPKDYISHKLYWERTGFRDPYSVYEQQEFAKCNHKCTDHDQEQNPDLEKIPEFQGPTNVPYCELPLFHAPLDPNSNPPNDYGHISLDGHYFNCE